MLAYTASTAAVNRVYDLVIIMFASWSNDRYNQFSINYVFCTSGNLADYNEASMVTSGINFTKYFTGRPTIENTGDDDILGWLKVQVHPGCS